MFHSPTALLAGVLALKGDWPLFGYVPRLTKLFKITYLKLFYYYFFLFFHTGPWYLTQAWSNLQLFCGLPLWGLLHARLFPYIWCPQYWNLHQFSCLVCEDCGFSPIRPWLWFTYVPWLSIWSHLIYPCSVVFYPWFSQVLLCNQNGLLIL